MAKRITRFCVLFGLLTFFIVPVSNAVDPNWKEDQDKMFKKIGLVPGEIIKKDNWQKIDGLVPDDIARWVKEGLIEMTIGEFKIDASLDAEWEEYGKKHNMGKYTLDKNGSIIEVATGAFPQSPYGEIFPDIDLKNDPDCGIKIMHNRDIGRTREGSMTNPFTVEWIGKDGFERVLQNEYYRYNFWGNKLAQEEKNQKGLFFMEITVVVAPYDLSGTAQLTYRKIDGSSDELYVYIPAIRRTKRMSGSNRSDPFMGSDFTIDDGYGWMGQTSNMQWKYIEKKIGLMCISKYSTDSYVKMHKQNDGSWVSDPAEGIKTGWQFEGCKQAGWAPITCVWVPREFYVITCLPEDPYYNMGKMEFWLDQKTLWGQYKLMWDIAGEYWKSSSFMGMIMNWGRTSLSSNMHLFYDVKTRHATVLRGCGKNIFGRDLVHRFMMPNMKEKFSVSRLNTWTK